MPPDPRTGTRFAAYLCPPASSAYYQYASALLGYDVRARQPLPLPGWLHPDWQAQASPYGLHLTLVEGFYTDPAHLDAVAAELRACVACLSPGADLHLHSGRVEAWEGGQVIAHRYDPGPNLRVLQTLLLARLAPYVTHSPFDDEVRAKPGAYPAPYERARLRHLRTPRGLDTWEPHFTLVQPYGGRDPAGLAARLDTQLAPYRAQTYEGVALFVKPQGETHWQIWDEPQVAR